MRSRTILCSVVAAAAAALMPLGHARAMNITVYDKVSTAEVWHGTAEDQEVEPGTTHGQQWDLEAFDLTGSTLTLYTGYNPHSPPSGPGVTQQGDPGDFFFSVNRDMVYGVDNYATAGDGHHPALSSDTFQYDYAVLLNYDLGNPTYEIYQLDDATLYTVYYRDNDESNAWALSLAHPGATKIGEGSYAFLNLGTGDVLVDGTTLTGGTHYALVFDVGFLGVGNDFTVKYTMACGNDNIIGKGTVVPEPGTMLLLGSGLAGLGVLRRRRRKPRP